jgi:hypothetical protein
VGPATVPGGGIKTVQTVSKFERFKNIQNFPNFDQPKRNLPELQKSTIKYGFEDLEKINNLLHRNFFRFGRDFE